MKVSRFSINNNITFFFSYITNINFSFKQNFKNMVRVCSFKYNHTRIVKHIADRTCRSDIAAFFIENCANVSNRTVNI
ncbi:hypothetical protein ExPUPEC79_02209 [Escherichia coli]|nr:hypothetical protein ExPUPEC79_02209 [Escherichia coli]